MNVPPDTGTLDAVSAQYLRPAKVADIDWIAGQQAETYPVLDAIPTPILMDWFKVNPNGFSIICDGNHNSIGHINLLPIKSNILERLRRGEIREVEVRGDSLHTPGEWGSITDLWVESTMLTEPNAHRRGRVLLGLMRHAPQVIARLADLSRLRNFYAISATEAGERLLHRMGFKKQSDANSRLDKHCLYVARSACVQENVRWITGKSCKRDGGRSA